MGGFLAESPNADNAGALVSWDTIDEKIKILCLMILLSPLGVYDVGRLGNGNE